jgi:hypothetical protein
MTHTFIIEIELTEPVALTDGSSDAAGGHTTLDHVPGTSLLGAFVTALGIAPTDPLFARMFLSPATRFLNAYPASASNNGGLRTLPRPLTFKVGKINRSRVRDSVKAGGEAISFADLKKHFETAVAPDTMKSSRGTFVAEGSPETEHAPQRTEQVHVGIDRTRRAAQDGVLFTYEAVRAGSKFIGAVQTDDDGVGAHLEMNAAFDLRIGRSRSAGYGHAKAKLTKAPAAWREYTPNDTTGAGSVVITLLSDYLPHLESAPATALCEELAALAGVKRSEVKVRSASTRQVRGFRGVWGLPRPTRTALAKGSVLVIEKPIDTRKLSDALARAIGARTNEGFGRVAVNWSIHGKSSEGAKTQRTSHGHAKQARPTIAVSTATTAAIDARRSERKLREFVEAALRLKAVKSAAEGLLPLPPAQLGNLRAAVSGTMSPAEIGVWFKALSEKTAGERWKRIDVPSIVPGKPHRIGHAFVWESLFGGECSHDDKLEGNISEANWKSAVAMIAKQVTRQDLADAANEQPETALRYLIAGLVSDVARRRNTRVEQEAVR